jgi:hypothetical protein
MSSRPRFSQVLKNGLTQQSLDQSKKIAADRWYVCVWIQISIPVEKKWFVNLPIEEEKFRQIRDAVGKEVLFSQKIERNFVSDDIKEKVVSDICSRAAEMGHKYFAHDDFAAKTILKIYADRQHHR